MLTDGLLRPHLAGSGPEPDRRPRRLFPSAGEARNDQLPAQDAEGPGGREGRTGRRGRRLQQISVCAQGRGRRPGRRPRARCCQKAWRSVHSRAVWESRGAKTLLEERARALAGPLIAGKGETNCSLRCDQHWGELQSERRLTPQLPRLLPLSLSVPYLLPHRMKLAPPGPTPSRTPISSKPSCHTRGLVEGAGAGQVCGDWFPTDVTSYPQHLYPQVSFFFPKNLSWQRTGKGKGSQSF